MSRLTRSHNLTCLPLGSIYLECDRIGGDGSSPASTPRPSRLSRISGRVRKMIRKAIMGYVPEEEVSYKERAAQQAAAAARLRGEPEVRWIDAALVFWRRQRFGRATKDNRAESCSDGASMLSAPKGLLLFGGTGDTNKLRSI